MYVKENVIETTNTIRIDRLSIINTKLKIKNDENFEISAIYRSHELPKQEFVMNIETFLNRKKNVKNHCVVGDFNIDLIDTNNISLEFLNNFLEKGYTPCFTDITRPSNSNSEGTCIDNYFIKTNLINVKPYKLLQSITDHYPLFVNFDNTPMQNVNNENYNYINLEKLKIIASTKNWNLLKMERDANGGIESIINEIQICTNMAQTTKKKNNSNYSKPRKNWITIGILTSCKTKELLYKIWRQDKDNEFLKFEYKNYQKILDRVIKDAKMQFEAKEVEILSRNQRHLWNYVNKKINKNKSCNTNIHYIIDDNNKKIENTLEIANYMNKYFCEIGEKISQNIKKPLNSNLILPELNTSTIFIKPTNHIEVKRIINDMKDKSGGVDNINVRILKVLSEYIKDPLAYLFNLCIEQAVWPDVLKRADVVPIFKSSNKHTASNYRPISLISNIAKILEKIIYTRIFEFIEKNKIINSQQFGFVRGRGTADALNYITNIIYNKLDKSKPLIITFLDLAKAFDTVDHQILLQKLYSYGIRGKAYDLIISYLSDRQQKVKLNKELSDSCKITIGVPQGTILGPLLFILYVNDLLNNMHKGAIVSYADDTAIISSGDTWIDAQEKMNNYLKNVNDWLILNRLSLNVMKTVYMTFGNYKDSVPEAIDIKIDNRILTRVSNYKYLGIVFDFNMKWDKHMESIINKTKYLIFVFYKMAKIMKTKTLLTLYYAFFHSIINYGIIAWGGAYNNNLNMLQRVQNKILKIIYKNNFVTENRPFNLRQSFAYESLKYHYKELKRKYLMVKNNTRNKSIQIPRITNSISNKNSYIVAIRLFNSLPNDLKNLELNKINAKNKIKKWVTLKIQ